MTGIHNNNNTNSNIIHGDNAYGNDDIDNCGAGSI